MLTRNRRAAHGGLPGSRASLLTAVLCLPLIAPGASVDTGTLSGTVTSAKHSISGSWLAPSERGFHLARRWRCGSAGGTRVFAFNLRCRRAMEIWRGPLPRAWTGANADIAGGVAVLCPTASFRRVQRSMTKRGTIDRSRLGPRIPVVWARVPSGE
jgi:hypothetical protein